MTGKLSPVELLALVGIDLATVDVAATQAKYRQERDLRLRSDNVKQYIESPPEFDSDPFADGSVEREPVVDEQVDVTIIGAGFGGLLAGTYLRKAGIGRIRLIERGGDVGGTWYWNRYPGLQCDVESYVYLPLLEELGYIPEDKYSFGEEIFEHARRIAAEFDLYDGALFQTDVTELVWDDGSARWTVRTDRDDCLNSRFVVIANGALAKPKLPGIPGIEEFTGHMFHTSRWDYGYTGGDRNGNLTGLADKRVGLIGTGATAMQIVPHLGRSAKHLYVFQRTPAAVAVRNNQPTDPSWAASLTHDWQQRRIENFTRLTTGGEEDVDLVDDSWTGMFQNITPAVVRRVEDKIGFKVDPHVAEELMNLSDLYEGEKLRRRVASIVEDPDTAESLKPWFYIFCKRPCFHDEYLATFNRPNVTLVDTQGRGVGFLRGNAAVVDDKAYELDCLIFGTGFEVGTSYTHRTGFDVVGRGGVRMSEKWAEGPRTFHGLQASGFPNCFLMGIVQNATTLNLTHMLTEQAKHLSYIVGEVRRRGATVVEATMEAEDEWLAELHRANSLIRDRWLLCTPSYLNNEGNIDDPSGYLANRYSAGPEAFMAILQKWREEGRLSGLHLRAGGSVVRA